MEKLTYKLKGSPCIKEGLETEQAIDLVKTAFLSNLAKNLNLYKVTSPIAVMDNTGVNDDLNGVERAIRFPIAAMPSAKGVIVHSLAKWKRLRIKDLCIEKGAGIVTDMKALRPDETLTPYHSILVDQWDWEKVIPTNSRTPQCLHEHVRLIYLSLRQTESFVYERYPRILPILPPDIKFIHSQELLDLYPNLTPKQREHSIAKAFGAVFITGIGCKLSNGEPHDKRAPDYDDWSTVFHDKQQGLNGDIIVWNPVTESAVELSSMGIRVDKQELLTQLSLLDCMSRIELPFHRMLLMGKLPSCIGGGIGQSRVCMFLLRKRHIGEVQVGVWPEGMREEYVKENVNIIV